MRRQQSEPGDARIRRPASAPYLRFPRDLPLANDDTADALEAADARHETLRNDSGIAATVAHRPPGVEHGRPARRLVGGPLPARAREESRHHAECHLAGGLRFVQYPITNGAAEGLNSKIMSIKRKAGGFRNPANFTTAIYSHCGGLDLYPR